MATHGLYVQKTASGAIYGVQIEDNTKNNWSITVNEYIGRNYEPPLAKLPDIGGYLAAKHRENEKAA